MRKTTKSSTRLVNPGTLQRQYRSGERAYDPAFTAACCEKQMIASAQKNGGTVVAHGQVLSAHRDYGWAIAYNPNSTGGAFSIALPGDFPYYAVVDCDRADPRFSRFRCGRHGGWVRYAVTLEEAMVCMGRDIAASPFMVGSSGVPAEDLRRMKINRIAQYGV